MSRIQLKQIFLGLLSTSFLLPSASLFAEIEEVVITAQRRSESLQDVPVAVTAFTDDQAARLQVTETLDLARIVPNFIAHNNTGLGTANTYSIRGLNNTESIATFDPPVGTYVDDFFIQRQNSNNYALFDIDRVEVLRGPQGTLFGRNTTGGAVRVILAEPAEEFGGFIEAGYGEFERYNFRASVDVPFNDSVRTKLSAYYINDDGFVENTTTGEDDVNQEENFGVRGAVQVDITSNVRWDASLTYIESDHANLLNNEVDNDRFTATGLTQSGAPLTGAVVGDKANFGLGNQTESLHFTSDVEIDTSFGQVNILTSVLSLDQDFVLDFFNGPFAFGGFTIANQGAHDQFSQEIKFSGSAFNDQLDYIAGFFYFSEDNETDLAQIFDLGAIGLFLPGGFPLIQYDRTMDNGVTSWAFYSQFDWHFNDQLTLTAGIRYTDEEKDFGISDNGNPLAGSVVTDATLVANGVPLDQSEKIVTPRFALEYKHSDDLMMFASATRGFKSGGWNARGTTAGSLIPFSPEKIWNYELGIRSEWLDNKLRINLTGFYSDISDFQLPSAFVDPATGAISFITQNFADLEVYGFEAEILYNPIESLTLFANIGIQESDYKSIDPAIVTQQAACRAGVPLPGGTTPPCAQGIVNPAGDIAPPVRSPEHQVAIGGYWTIPIGANMNLVPTINVTDYGKHNISTSGQDSALISGYTLVNGGMALEHTTQNWSVTAACKNCTNQEYFVSFLAGKRYLGDPTTWSVTFNKRF